MIRKPLILILTGLFLCFSTPVADKAFAYTYTTSGAEFDALADKLKMWWVKAFMMMTSQLTATMIDQVYGIGMIFDAKQQLEIQRDLQELYAEAHKDYHPSEQMCEIGTLIRNLADTEKRADLTQVALNNRVLERELVSGLALSVEGEDSDTNSRFEHFKEIYCNEYDNGNGLDYLCKDGNKDSVRKNRDIDYTTTLEAPLTLKIDFLEGGSPTQDERNVMALVNYLFQHNPFPDIGETYMTMKSFTKPYQDMRSVIAMRGVARNSIASFIAQKTEGPEPEDGESNAAPYIYALLTEFGWDKEEIEKMFGEKPSYYAQMEIMTQKIFQHPNFYMNLYDKPANVKRVRAAIRAIKTMQDRDIHEAMMRREMLLSMILELRVREQQRAAVNKIKKTLLNTAPEQ
ncbi:MAG: hypothetical protein H6853_01200 [Rhodospirillales bacterium]|nr:hypothetical protein [Alphaproteobacteria bacterium]USO03928.1 MAG: hypothetical protein H6853_01200 [Rhodospirillales bacterium]